MRIRNNRNCCKISFPGLFYSSSFIYRKGRFWNPFRPELQLRKRSQGEGDGGVVRRKERQKQACPFREGFGRGEKPPGTGVWGIQTKQLPEREKAAPQTGQEDSSDSCSADSFSVRRSSRLVSQGKPYEDTGGSILCENAGVDNAGSADV